MNDRISKQPPTCFLHEEQAMEDYTSRDSNQGGRGFEDTKLVVDNASGQSRPSSMYRFGKALANAFNPAMVWHGMRSGIWNSKVDETSDGDRQVMQDRKVKAEKLYAELKHSGYQGFQRKNSIKTSTNHLVKEESDNDMAEVALHRDSGVDVDSSRSSDEQRRDSIILEPRIDVESLPTPSMSELGQFQTPTSEEHSTRRTLRSLSKPSLRSLKKVKSHFTLPASKRRPASPVPEVPVSGEDFGHQVIKKQSKKELQKQERLSKKISNLETQLEKARRDLQLSAKQGEDQDTVGSIPVTLSMRKPLKRFVPGALPSLPSESIVGMTSADHDPGSFASRATALAAENALEMNDDDLVTPSRPYRTRTSTGALRRKTNLSVPQNSTQVKSGTFKKRKHETSVDHLPSSEVDEYSGDQTKATPKPRQKRAQNTIKVEKDESPARMSSTKDAKSKESKKSDSSKRPNAEPLHPGAKVPFSPSQVDQDKLLSLREQPSDLPFGKASEGIVNIRREFPNTTNDEVIRFMAQVLGEDKRKQVAASRSTRDTCSDKVPTDYTSINHHDQIATPFLPPPVSASSASLPSDPRRRPTRASSAKKPNRRSTSQSPESSTSKQMKPTNTRPPSPSPKPKGKGVQGKPFSSTRSIDKSDVPPVPKLPEGLEGKRVEVKSRRDRASMTGNERDDAEEWRGWDDDVF